MKVHGNNFPDAIHIERYLPKQGYVEVRLCENINEISVVSDLIEQAVTMYEYDEYVLQIPQRANLAEEIEANLTDWLATGRVLETNHNASLVQDMKTALEILGVTVDE